MEYLLPIFIVAVIALAIYLKIADVMKLRNMTPEQKEAEMVRRRANAEREAQLNQQVFQNLKDANKTSQENQARNNYAKEYGEINSAMMCPHCQTKGKVRTKHITQKKGISGSKAAAAVVTGGVSILAVGLARKEGATQAHCDNCKNTWLF